MARLPLVDPDDPGTDPAARDALLASVRGSSIQPNVYRAIANNPAVLRAVAHFGSVAYVNNSLTPAQRELTYLTASLVNDCHY
jgi:alkylhydroperoxidase family enzyme